jgi:predicted small lipoprotein YifL
MFLHQKTSVAGRAQPMRFAVMAVVAVGLGFSILALSACGQKGPLRLPQVPVAASAASASSTLPGSSVSTASLRTTPVQTQLGSTAVTTSNPASGNKP